jgi:hypothetical protein
MPHDRDFFFFTRYDLDLSDPVNAQEPEQTPGTAAKLLAGAANTGDQRPLAANSGRRPAIPGAVGRFQAGPDRSQSTAVRAGVGGGQCGLGSGAARRGAARQRPRGGQCGLGSGAARRGAARQRPRAAE